MLINSSVCMHVNFSDNFLQLLVVDSQIISYLGKGNCLMQQLSWSQQIPQISQWILLEGKNGDNVLNNYKQFQESFSGNTQKYATGEVHAHQTSWPAGLWFSQPRFLNSLTFWHFFPQSVKTLSLLPLPHTLKLTRPKVHTSQWTSIQLE